MAEYNKKWADLFPATIGNQNRPTAGVDNTLPYETDKFPQHIANDPVRYDKMNAVVSQSMSNDERLNEKIKRTSDDLAAHNKDPKAHATGIAGNAATASKLLTPRTISLTGKAAGSTTFDGSANAAINVTSVNADTASKLSTARKINITGNATGAANFDGTGDVSINTTVNESKHAAAADTVNATAPNGGAADLVFGIMANDDSARIRVGGSTDNGWLEIATSDNGNEPIYARQYYGSFQQNGAKSITNEVAILDSNGNTKFPKNVTAASFTGPLNGNATSATNSAAADKVNNSGNRGNLASGQKPAAGLQVFQCYTNAGYPQQYGNVLSIGGTGDGEFFLGWQADARPYYRSKVDVSNDWTDWKPLAYISDINYYAPTKTGGGASGTWPISISGNAATATTANALNGIINRDPATNNHAIIPGANARDYCEFHEYGAVWNFIKTSDEASTTVASIQSDGFHGNVVGNAATATNADKLDGYHASDFLNRITDIKPKTAAAIGQFRELVVNDSHQVKLPDGGTWAYFCYTYNSWSGDDSNGEHRTRTGAGIAAGGTVIHTDGSINSSTINNYHLNGTTSAGGADGNNIIVGGFCWRIA